MTIDDCLYETSNYSNNCYQASVTLAVLLQKTAGQQLYLCPYYIVHILVTVEGLIECSIYNGYQLQV